MPNVRRGSDTRGLLVYLVDTRSERTANVHTEPHLVAGSAGAMAWWGDAELSVASAVAIAGELDGPRRAYGVQFPKEPGAGHVWHTSLSLRAEEGELPDEQWAAIAAGFMARMGLDEGPEAERAPVRWVAVRHGLSAGRNGQPGNDHVHIAAVLVREDGTKANVWRDQPRSQRACRELEREHGLVAVRTEGIGQRGLRPGELARAAREGTEPARWRCERTVRAVAAQVADEAGFVAGVQSAGLLVRPRFADGTTDVVVGYSVAVRPPAGQAAIWYGGGRLAKDLSLPRLRAGWDLADPVGNVAAVNARAAAAVARWQAAWRGKRTDTTGRGTPVVVDDGLLARYAEELAGLRERLALVPPEDGATWGRAAHDLAGVVASWSLAVEGARPGPLAAAARELARTAQLPAHAAVAPVPLPSLRGVSLAVASASVGGRGAVGQAVLLRQLGATLGMLHAAQVAQARAGEAHRLADLAEQRLAAIHAALPSEALAGVVAAQRRARAAQEQAVGVAPRPLGNPAGQQPVPAGRAADRAAARAGGR